MTIFGPDIETNDVNPDPFVDEIISIQYRDGETGKNHLYRRWEFDSEADLLFDFFMDYADIQWMRKDGAPLRVGFRLTDFDLPFILVRTYETDVFDRFRKGPGFVWTNVIAGPSCLDLYQLFGGDMVPFEEWRRLLIETESPVGIDKIPELYDAGEFEQIEEYIVDELEALEAVYEAARKTDHFSKLMDTRKSTGFKRPLE